jgi:hypothetical protein
MGFKLYSGDKCGILSPVVVLEPSFSREEVGFSYIVNRV